MQLHTRLSPEWVEFFRIPVHLGENAWDGGRELVGMRMGRRRPSPRILVLTPLLGKGLVIFMKQLSETTLACAHALLWGGFECTHFIPDERGVSTNFGEQEGVFRVNENNRLDFGVL